MDIAFGILINAPFFTGQITEKTFDEKEIKGTIRKVQRIRAGLCFRTFSW
jgi:hypothetical protein